MLTRQTAKYFGVFIILFTIGLLLSSKVLFAAAATVLLFLLIVLLFEPPREISIKLKETNGSVFFIDECVELAYEVTVNSGIGTITCVQKPAAVFELAEGNNLKVFWKGIGKKTFSISYKLRCTKDGVYKLPKIVWESQHMFELRQGGEGESGESIEITVKSPAKTNVVKPIVSVLTQRNTAKLGMASTDFRELRDYVFGDPISVVNWKATAARISSGVNWPVVTEYDVEEKKSLFIFLDASQNMEVGTDIINAFEYAKQVAQSISYAFINEGFRVGMYVYNNDSQPLYPDVGKRQLHNILQQLATVKTSHNGSEGLVGAVKKCKPYLTKYEASSIIITRLDSTSVKPLIEGIKMIKGKSNGMRANPLVVKINVFGHETVLSDNIYEKNAVQMVDMLHKSIETQLKRARVTLVSWDPIKDTFHTVLSRTKR